MYLFLFGALCIKKIISVNFLDIHESLPTLYLISTLQFALLLFLPSPRTPNVIYILVIKKLLLVYG